MTSNNYHQSFLFLFLYVDEVASADRNSHTQLWGSGFQAASTGENVKPNNISIASWGTPYGLGQFKTREEHKK
jgi:hypothetical protein